MTLHGVRAFCTPVDTGPGRAPMTRSMPVGPTCGLSGNASHGNVNIGAHTIAFSGGARQSPQMSTTAPASGVGGEPAAFRG